MAGLVIVITIVVLIGFSLLITVAVRYKKCPSDHIMVVFGKIVGEGSSKCIHGGAQFVWPFFQDYRYMALRPMQIDINLKGALSNQNIRINTPSTYTIGISTEPEIMNNAAERLLSMTPTDIESTAREIIFGQQRLVIASMEIEEINANRDAFLHNIKQNVESELNKIGLRLINVNITDITDEEGYLEALGKKAAAEVTNRAKVEVAQQMKIGETGKAEAEKEQRIAIAEAEAEAATGEANASQEKRIAIAEAEARATRGEADANQEKRVAVATADATAQKGEAEADKNQRVAIMSNDALAVSGENASKMDVAKSDAGRREVEEESRRRQEAAQVQANARIKSAQFEAEEDMQIKKAAMVRQQEIAAKIVPAEITKQEREILAEADAEVARRRARGDADAVFADMEANARGVFEGLKAKAEGFQAIVGSCDSDPHAAATMLVVEKLEHLVRSQTEAIKGIKIDKVVVWDGQNGGGDGKNATAGFLSGLAKSLPPIHDLAQSAGIDLPDYLGRIADQDKANVEPTAPEAPEVPAPTKKSD
jgi:flotillin